MTFPTTDLLLMAVKNNGNMKIVLLVIVIFTVAFVSSGMVTYKLMRLRKQDKNKDTEDEKGDKT